MKDNKDDANQTVTNKRLKVKNIEVDEGVNRAVVFVFLAGVVALYLSVVIRLIRWIIGF